MLKYLEYLNVNIECSHCDKRDHVMLQVNHDWGGMHGLQIAQHFSSQGWEIQLNNTHLCPVHNKRDKP